LALARHFHLAEPKSFGGSLAGLPMTLDDGGVAERLGTDLRYVNPPYVGPPLPALGGLLMNLWGIRFRQVANKYGVYFEPVGLPYATWSTVEEAEKWPWPSPDWFDYSAVPAMCAKHPDLAIITGGNHVQGFINHVAFGRGVEQVLIDIAMEDPVYLCIVERRHRFFLAYVERVLEAAAGRIDLVLCGDDFGSQRGPSSLRRHSTSSLPPERRSFSTWFTPMALR